MVNTISDILSDGVDEGTIRSDLSTDFLANSLLGMLRAYVKDSDASYDLKKKIEFLEDLFMNGASLVPDRSTVYYSGHLSR